MSDSNVLDYLREQFSRIHARFDLLQADVNNLKVRMSALEADVAHLRLGQAEPHSRLDRMDARMSCIERRLDLADAS